MEMICSVRLHKEEVVWHWNRLPGVVVGALFLGDIQDHAGPGSEHLNSSHDQCSQVLVLEPVLFNIFFGDLDKEIGCTLISLQMTSRWEEVLNLPRGRKAVQRDQDRVDHCMEADGMIQAMIQAWSRVAGRLCGRNGPGGVGQCSEEPEPALCPCSHEGQVASWLILEIVLPVGVGT